MLYVYDDIGYFSLKPLWLVPFGYVLCSVAQLVLLLNCSLMI